jgi:hypothetical protein
MEIAGKKVVAFRPGRLGQKTVAGNRGNLGLVAVTRQHFGAKTEKFRDGVAILLKDNGLLLHLE